MAEFWRADEPREIAETLMGYHPDLIGAHVAFIFQEKASKNDGQPVIGKAFRVPDKYQPLMELNSSGEQGYDFMIVIGLDAWQELGLQAKTAWIDHLLEHCYGEEDEKTGDMKWKIRRPSVNAFPIILRRHGINWDQNIQHLGSLNLDKDEAVAPVTRSSDNTVSVGIN